MTCTKDGVARASYRGLFGDAWLVCEVVRPAGATWDVAANGMRASFLPPELAGDPDTQDPHRIARCDDEPDVLWCQHHGGIFRSTDLISQQIHLTAFRRALHQAISS